MAGIPRPKPSFLDECISIGSVNGEKRWKSIDSKRIYTWDSLHGEIEIFNNRGKHLGVYDPYGKLIKGAKKGRTIDV